MRLIDTGNYTLHEFTEDIPKYAILSHRWQDEEALYKQYRKRRVRPDSQGYRKIVQCCDFARRRGLGWVWIDTCCIDKSSSAELSEAINSMFHWYSQAEECYAFLADVITADSEDGGLQQFATSRWFTRGWTLQELIAPRHVLFVDRMWSMIGVKWSSSDVTLNPMERHLGEEITKITGIPQEVLASPEARFFFSVAQRMSWAANRTTTRREDAAYSLLGIFGINLPLLYGEHNDAFMRLQREVFARTGDESIFTWPLHHHAVPEGATVMYDTNCAYGMLARSPQHFHGLGSVRTIATKEAGVVLTGYGAEITVDDNTERPRVFYSAQNPRVALLLFRSVDAREHPDHVDSKRSHYQLFLHLTGCGHYGRFAPPDNVDEIDWVPFEGKKRLIVHHSRSEAFRYCSSIMFDGQYFEGQHFGHVPSSRS